MANTSKTVWLFDLRENTITRDVTNDYMANVRKLKSKTVSDIASEIVSERTEYRPETIENIVRLYQDKVMDNLCAGNIVTDSLGTYMPSITGNFIGTSGAIDPKKHACTVNVSLSKEFRERISGVSPQFSGTVQSLGGARVDSVEDVESGSTAGVLTPGGTLKVSGKKIRCLNEDGSSTGRVLFINRETETEYPVGRLATNDPSSLIFNIPADLPDGEYTLRVETYYTAGGALLRSVRTIDYPEPLYVGAIPSGGEDEEGEAPDPIVPGEDEEEGGSPDPIV